MTSHADSSIIPEYFLKKTRIAAPFSMILFGPYKGLQIWKLRFLREAWSIGCDGRLICASATGRGKARFLRYCGWK